MIDLQMTRLVRVSSLHRTKRPVTAQAAFLQQGTPGEACHVCSRGSPPFAPILLLRVGPCQ